jgi:hypothetical protein
VELKESSMNERKQIRQGDVLLVPVDTIPEQAKAVQTAGAVVLAEGEQSGHLHRFTDANVTGFRAETAEMAAAAGLRPELRAMTDYIEVGGGGADLRHEYGDGRKADHAPISVPPGKYRVVQQREEIGDEIAVRAFD